MCSSEFDLHDDASHTQHNAAPQVSFKYPGTNKKLLKDVSFTVKAGKFVGICGERGASLNFRSSQTTESEDLSAGFHSIYRTEKYPRWE